jgi:hypothetical protein
VEKAIFGVKSTVSLACLFHSHMEYDSGYYSGYYDVSVLRT